MQPATESLRQPLLAAAAQLAIDLLPTQADQLLGYLGLLQRWNATYNLTSIRDPAQMLTQHVVDCLAVMGPLRREAGDGPFRLLDVGSGGGLPGAVIAMLSPAADVTCVDTVGKKAAFIQQVSAELGLANLHAKHARVEEWTSAPFDVVASRAFASLTDFTRLTRPHLAPHGCWMAMKGKRPDAELLQLTDDIEVFHVEPLTVPGLNAERCIAWMRPKRSL